MGVFILSGVLALAIVAIVLTTKQKNPSVSPLVTLVQKETNIEETVSLKFSFSVFFFGSIPMLMRNDYVNALKTITIQLLNFLAVISSFSTFLLYSKNGPYFYGCILIFNLLTNLALAMGYNKSYASMLLEVGFKPVTDTDKKALLTAKVKNV